MVRMMRRARLLGTLAFAGLGLAACDGGGGGAHYRYDDSLYWNDYYHTYGRPDRPTRPDRPAQAVPPIGTLPRPVPPIGTAPRPRPPIGTLPRPMPRIAPPPRISPPIARPATMR